jgi:hypothetical protein
MHGLDTERKGEKGMLYSKLPMWYHLIGYPEIMLQTLAFSIWLVWWERQSGRSQEAVAKKENPLVAEIFKAVMTACFAYMGYAAGGLLLAFIANARAVASGAGGVDIEAAGGNFKIQFMFVVAFLVNTATVFWIARRWQANWIALRGAFLLFWFVDAAIPWLYQTLVFGSSFIPTAIMLGFLPAAIIAMSIRMNYRKFALQARR